VSVRKKVKVCVRASAQARKMQQPPPCQSGKMINIEKAVSLAKLGLTQFMEPSLSFIFRQAASA
jgi:hypothetical protein